MTSKPKAHRAKPNLMPGTISDDRRNSESLTHSYGPPYPHKYGYEVGIRISKGFANSDRERAAGSTNGPVDAIVDAIFLIEIES